MRRLGFRAPLGGTLLGGFLLAGGLGAAPAATLEFQLLTWADAAATSQLPSGAGRKPSGAMPAAGDWLVFTADDALSPAANNPQGALSHNFVDITGAGGPGFNLAPSLSGALTLRLEPGQGSNWSVQVTALAYQGQANPLQAMNQFLVTPGSPATTNGAFQVDGLGNAGEWRASAAARWAIQYLLDFYFATNADGDPSPADVDATFSDQPQTGFLIPVSQLTASGVAGLGDPLGFYTGDFGQYLLGQIRPRLPAQATYLLFTQMGKTHPAYAELGLPITTGSLIGNTTVAYTTQTLSAAPRILSLRWSANQAVLRFTGLPAQTFAVQRSLNLADWETLADPELSSPEAGVLEWTDPAAGGGPRFYRVVALTP